MDRQIKYYYKIIKIAFILYKNLLRVSIIVILLFISFNIYSKNNPQDLFIIEQYQKNQKYSKSIDELQEQSVLLNNKLTVQDERIKQLNKLVIDSVKSNAIKKITNNTNNKITISNKEYRNARNLVLSEQYKKAILEFEKYIKKYPNADNIADALFWQASSYMANKEYAKASHKYLLFQINHKNHYKVPNALYKLAIAQYELGLADKSEIIFKSIIRRFPNHTITKFAKQSLKELTKNKKSIAKIP